MKEPLEAPEMVSTGRFLLRLIAGAVVANLLIFALLGYAARESYNQYQARAMVDASNIARILERDLSDMFDKIDIALFGLEREVDEQLRSGRPNISALDATLEHYRVKAGVETLRVANAVGRVIAGTGVKEAPPINVSDRPYFQTLRDAEGDAMVLAGPFASRISGMPSLFMVRRISLDEGHFGGVVYSVLPTASIQHFLSQIDVGPHGGISLRNKDMAIVVRYPDPNSAFIGNNVISQELRALLDRGLTSGNYFSGTSWDGTARQVAFSKIGVYPLYLNVGLASEDYLQPWWADVRRYTTAFAAFAALSVLWVAMQLAAWRQSVQAAQSMRCHLELVVQQRTEELVAANNRLEALSHLDGLTGLSNRRHLDQMLSQEWRRCLRQKSPLSCIMVDADEFKRFNDRYGHMAGDDCLRGIAQVLRAHSGRAGDVAARYGGEEFVLLLPMTDAEPAFNHAESIRLAIQELAIPHADSPEGVVTVSLGVATAWPDELGDMEGLIKNADMALYAAKQAGRNCTQAAPR